MYFNKAILVGNLTRDPELKVLPSGINVCSFSIATNRYWRDKDGERQESVDYHNIVVFGRQAETVNQYMRKGSQVLVEGRLQTRSWDDQATNTKRYRTEIIADRVQFGSSPNRGEGATSPATTPSSAEKEELETIEYPDEQFSAEDIPF